MRIEDMAKWTVDELKAEVVRLSEECEKKQVNELNSIPELMTPDIDIPFEELKSLRHAHQSDCITINQLQTALDVLVDRYANLRKIHGVG